MSRLTDSSAYCAAEVRPLTTERETASKGRQSYRAALSYFVKIIQK